MLCIPVSVIFNDTLTYDMHICTAVACSSLPHTWPLFINSLCSIATDTTESPVGPAELVLLSVDVQTENDQDCQSRQT